MARHMLENDTNFDKAADVLLRVHAARNCKLCGIEVDLYVDDRQPIFSDDDCEDEASLSTKEIIRANLELAVHPRGGNVHEGYPVPVIHVTGTRHFIPVMFVERDFSMRVGCPKAKSLPFNGRTTADVISALERQGQAQKIAATVLHARVCAYMMLDEERIKLKHDYELGWHVEYIYVHGKSSQVIITLKDAANVSEEKLRQKLYNVEREIVQRKRGS